LRSLQRLEVLYLDAPLIGRCHLAGYDNAQADELILAAALRLVEENREIAAAELPIEACRPRAREDRLLDDAQGLPKKPGPHDLGEPDHGHTQFHSAHHGTTVASRSNHLDRCGPHELAAMVERLVAIDNPMRRLLASVAEHR
jgi:hypothetical protein